jgi:formate dehydrogenase major subunit
MTNSWIDLKNADVILVCGANPAENHPVSFKWITAAKDKGAKLIVVDPRFTRTAAKADTFARIRPGTDAAFFGGLINYIITNKLYHEEYIKNYTNASYLVNPGFSFKDGVFSGYDEDLKSYDYDTWTYQLQLNGEVSKDTDFNNPNCVLELMRDHYSRYTADRVSKICGMSEDSFKKIADAFCRTGKPDRSGTILYAMGLTQHTTGTQNVRAAGMVQLLLGNIGIAGGGLNALRGAANVQGSTDFGLLFNLLPGYLNMPLASKHETFSRYKDAEVAKSGYAVNKTKWFVSLLKAWWGEYATEENDFLYEFLPKLGDGYDKSGYSWVPLFEAMYADKINGLLCWGQNPVLSGPNANMTAAALTKLDWLVVSDLFETETSVFWKRPGMKPEDVRTEVFLLPAAASFEKEGSVTNSARLIQWMNKAADPPGEARPDLWIIDSLFKALKDAYSQEATAKFSEPLLKLNWDYGDDEPDPHLVAKEINGFTVTDKTQIINFTKLSDDGSTMCGNWIYSGFYPGDKKADNRAAQTDTSRDPDKLGLYPEWAYSWPLNRRIIYNRCSANAEGVPYDKRRMLVSWDGAKWVNNDVPDFSIKDVAGAIVTPDKTAKSPFIMLPEGQARFFIPDGLIKDGPLTEHYEPVESPSNNLLSGQQNNPLVKIWQSDMDKMVEPGSSKYPYIGFTCRVAEHWQTGSISRNLPWLAEMMPEMFIEISPELAARHGIENGNKVKVISPRGEVTGVAIVTNRIKPFELSPNAPEAVSMPDHYGFVGYVTGGDEDKDYSANQVTSNVYDPNTGMPEYKAFLVDIRKVG